MSIMEDVRFRSGDAWCAGWVVRPDAGTGVSGPGPVVVLGHGLGGTRDMRLAAFAESFCDDGYVCVVFDYRHFGDSEGQPRQLLDIGRQLEDWAAAIAFARSLPDCDPDRVVLWGSSFGGGHVFSAAARDGRVAAVVAQCPFTHGLASALRLDPVASVRVVALALVDVTRRLTGRAPRTVALAGPRGSAALMTAPDAVPGYDAQLGPATTFRNEVAARFVFQLVRYFPGRSLARLGCPVLVCLCSGDTVAPPGPTRRYAGAAVAGELREYPYGHFDIYTGEPFETVSADQRSFLRRHVAVVAG